MRHRVHVARRVRQGEFAVGGYLRTELRGTAESFEAAYLEAYEAANATGAADGTREGRIAGTAAAR